MQGLEINFLLSFPPFFVRALFPCSCHRLEKKIATAKARLEKMKLDMTIKDELKTVALGTSKINYLDPRITVAWCKRHEVPIEKVRPATATLNKQLHRLFMPTTAPPGMFCQFTPRALCSATRSVALG